MNELITNLSAAFTVQSKIEYIREHYSGDDDILFGVLPDTEQGRREAHEIIRQFLRENGKDWSPGAVINGKQIEFVSPRIDQIQDFEMPDYLQQKSDITWESVEEMEKRTGKKCTGSKEYYVTVSVCRRYVNPLNGIAIYDHEINGATPVKLFR